MKSVKLHNNYPNAGYSEMGQDTTVKFSVVSRKKDKYYLEYKPFMCKDYFTELVIGRAVNRILPDVYGFHAKEVWSSRTPYIFVSGSKTEIERIKKAFYILHDMEAMMLIDPNKYSKILLVKDKPNQLIIKVPTVWIKSPVLFSLYTLVIRSFVLAEVANLSLSYKTFVDLAKLVNDTDHTDIVLIKELYSNRFDLDTFLLNYKEILGSDPLTGYNDKSFKKCIKTSDTSYFKLKNRINESHEFWWDPKVSHNFSGIVTLAKQITTHKESEMRVGYNWTVKYLEIANG